MGKISETIRWKTWNYFSWKTRKEGDRMKQAEQETKFLNDIAKAEQENIDTVSEEIKQELAIRKKIEIESVFGKPKPDFKRLGLGLHQNQLYIGSSVWLNEKRYSVIITSNKKHYIGYTEKDNTNEIKENFKLDYRTEFEEESIDFSWPAKEIKNYLLDNYEKYSLEELYERVLTGIKFFCYFEDERLYKLFAADIISTYFLPIFSHIARIQFRGNAGSGKTKITYMYWLMGFNSFFISSISESDLFRSLESTCSVVCVDNFDHLGEDTIKAVRQLYETGFTEGSTYRRRDRGTGGQFISGKFRIFSKIILNGIQGLDGSATESRTLIFNLLEPATNKKTEELKNRWPENNESFEEIRNSLKNYALDNWQQIKETYTKLKEKEFSGRELNLLKPLLTIAKNINEETYKDIKELCKEVLESQKVEELENSEDYQLFILLDELTEQDYYATTSKELCEKFISRYYGDFEGEIYKKLKFKFQKRIPEILRLTGKIGLRKGHAGALKVEVHRKHLDMILESRKYKEPQETTLTTTTTLTNTPTQPLQPNKENNTNICINNGDNGGCGESGESKSAKDGGSE